MPCATEKSAQSEAISMKAHPEWADGDIETEWRKTMATRKTTGRKSARTARKTVRKTARATGRTGRKVARAARKTGRKVARTARKTGRKPRLLKANLGQKEAKQQELSEEQMSHMEAGAKSVQ